MAEQTVLIVDDEAYITQSFARLFRKEPFRVLEAHSGHEALSILEREQVDVVVSDQRMPGMTGAQLFAKIQQRYPHVVRILLSGYTDFQALTYAINNGAISEFISKPWDRDKLIRSIRRALEVARKQAQDATYSEIFNSTSDGVAVMNEELRILDANPAFEQATGYNKGALKGKLLGDIYPDLSIIDPASIASGKGWQDELWLLRRDRTLGLFHVSLTRLGPGGFSLTLRDITEIRRSELSSRHDLLTGLLNRSSFIKEIEFAIANGASFSIISVDLARFRQVNESLGHETGDGLLCRMAEMLRQGFSRDDPHARVARIGNDEFAVLTYHLGVGLDQRLQAWLRGFREPVRVGDHDLFVHLNLGISERSPRVPLDDTQQLFQQAITARHRAAFFADGRPRRYESGMSEGVRERMKLHNDLHKVIPNNELLLLYQPKVDVRTGLTSSAEALVRWRHPEQGVINPARFVAIAEESGLIVDIGDWCISEAFRQIAEWRSKGVRDLGVAINLSPRQFGNPGLVSMLDALTERYELESRLIELELTESTLLDDMERAQETMKMIKERGFGFALDDFGTGYASFDYLKRFPFSTLKIDRSFILEIATSARAQSIVRSMIEMAHELGQKVVAEGVEQKEQAEVLRQLGCDLIQGFLYSRPLPPQMMLERVRKERTRKARESDPKQA